jgi:hypothetical protein
VLTRIATLTRRHELARVARRVGAAALVPSPVLLTMEGPPERFHHMLWVVKPTSPMSVGSWTLLAFSAAQGGAWVLGEARLVPAPAGGWPTWRWAPRGP